MLTKNKSYQTGDFTLCRAKGDGGPGLIKAWWSGNKMLTQRCSNTTTQRTQKREKDMLDVCDGLTGVRGGHGLGEDAVSDGALHVEGKYQRHHDDAIMPYSPHQGLSDKTQWNMDH